MRAAIVLFVLLLSAPARGEAETGAAAIYRERCAQCHEGGVARAPDIAALKQMSRERVRAALASGSMTAQAQGLTDAQLDEISRYLAGATATADAATTGLCAAASGSFTDPLAGPHWNGWGVDLARHRFQPAAMAGLAADDVPKLKLKWASP